MDSNKICRICLSNKNDMENIFNVIDIMKTIAPIQLEKEDGLPSVICPDCLLQANQAYNFRQLCIKSDDTLRQQLLLLNNEETNHISIYPDNSEKGIENGSQINNEEENTNSQINNEEEENTNESNEINTDSNRIAEEIKIETILYCRFCDIHFDKTKDYLEHGQNHREELKCHICEKIFETYQQFTRHMYMHKQKGSYLCKTCGKILTRRENLKIHERIHTGTKLYKCSFCDKSFVQWSEQKSHLLTHTKEKSHLCNICGNKYARSHHLQHHIKRKHLLPPDEKPYICVCGKSFQDQSILNRHQKIVHTTERKYVCGECNKGFKIRMHLRQHEKIHQRDKPFACSTCERSFKFKHVLQAHMNTHSK